MLGEVRLWDGVVREDVLEGLGILLGDVAHGGHSRHGWWVSNWGWWCCAALGGGLEGIRCWSN
jgi:hypothetical protein